MKVVDKRMRGFLQELEKLETRPLPLSGKSARGYQAALFRGLAELGDDDFDGEHREETLGRLFSAFAERLGDAALLPTMLETCFDRPMLLDGLLAALAERAEAGDTWCAERLLPLLGAGADGLTELHRLVMSEEAAIDAKTAYAVLAERSRTPVRRRDPISTLVSGRAVGALSRVCEADPVARETLTKTIVWETVRTGKEEPTLALDAIAALPKFPLFERMRTVKQLAETIKRRVCLNRLEEVDQAARAELGPMPPNLIDDILATPFEMPGWITIKPDGIVESTGSEDHGDYTRSFERQVLREAERSLSQWRARLEGAMVGQERWPLEVWRAAFADAGCPVRENIIRRLIWLRIEDDFTTMHGGRWNGEKFVDVFGEPLPDSFPFVAVAHPMLMDKDELDLWREEVLGDAPRQPFPQLFRNFFRKPPSDNFLDCFMASQPPDLGRGRGWTGLPLRGRSPWELTRVIDNTEVTVLVEGADQLVSSIDWDGEPSDLAESELALDLFDLIGAAYFGDHMEWQSWNTTLLGDRANAWSIALDHYKRAPKRIPALRKKLVQWMFKQGVPKPEGLRFEGRFCVIPGQAIVELGSGNMHDIDRRAWLPPRESQTRDVPMPHDPESDPQLTRVLGLIAWLATRACEED